MKDVSIEYAHIYTNNHIGDEHKLSLDILGEMQKSEKSTSLVVMVDDYSFPDPSFNYEEFIAWLTEKGYKPDIVFRESQLIPLCDELLKIMEDEDLQLQLGDYIRAKKYPCSLFIAAWYLLRLGHLSYPLFDPQYVSKRLINILPESFRPFEDKALEIITATPFNGAVAHIEHRYFQGRLVA